MAFLFLLVLHMIIMSTEFFTGITVNGFLIIMNCNDLIKTRKLGPIQILLICIGISRLGLQMMLMVQSIFYVFFPLDYDENIYNARVMFFWMFFSSISLWFATALSVFYCLKISGFTHSCFLWLKFRISKLIYWLLLGGFLFSVGIAAVCIKAGFLENEADDVLRNTSLQTTYLEVKDTNEVFLVNLALILPLTIFVMCTSMLFISLYKHTNRMQNGLHGFSNVRAEAHINALRTVITFFCFFISYFATFMANMTFKIPYRSYLFFMVKEIMAAFPAGHSLIIVLSNSKQQQSFRRILCLKKK